MIFTKHCEYISISRFYSTLLRNESIQESYRGELSEIFPRFTYRCRDFQCRTVQFACLTGVFTQIVSKICLARFWEVQSKIRFKPSFGTSLPWLMDNYSSLRHFAKGNIYADQIETDFAACAVKYRVNDIIVAIKSNFRYPAFIPIVGLASVSGIGWFITTFGTIEWHKVDCYTGN